MEISILYNLDFHCGSVCLLFVQLLLFLVFCSLPDLRVKLSLSSIKERKNREICWLSKAEGQKQSE